jgi:hypothetical protein
MHLSVRNGTDSFGFAKALGKIADRGKAEDDGNLGKR